MSTGNGFSLRDFGFGFALGAAITGAAAPIVIRRILPGGRHARPPRVAITPVPGTGRGAPATPAIPAHAQPSAYDGAAAASTLKEARQAAQSATTHAVRGELEAAVSSIGHANIKLGMAVVHNQHAPPGGGQVDLPNVIKEVTAAEARVTAAIRKR